MNNNQLFDQQYFQLCSEKTLQTNKEGFFLTFANAVAEKVGEKWIKNVFGKLKTDKERIRKIYQDDKIKDFINEFLINVQEIYRKKNSEISRTRRLEAEASLKMGDRLKALNLFSQSILRAPSRDENLSLSLLERSKILITMNEYSSALVDVQMSLKENLCDNLKHEAFWVMAVCYKALNEDNKAKVAADLAEKLMGNNIKLIELFHDDLKKQHQEKKKDNKKEAPTVDGDKHQQFKNASKKIGVKKSRELGRYVVANDVIKTGETLVVEPPYVSCLFPEKFGTHCHHCFQRFLSPVGCPHCSSVAFCSTQCRDLAVSTYHKYECKFLDLLFGSGMSVLSHTALRVITQNPLEKSLEIYKNRNTDEFFNLCTNSSKRLQDDFLQRTLMAAFLLRCLQKSGYFKKDFSSITPTEECYQIGEMLLHSLQILQFNAHEIYETLCSGEKRLKGARPVYIGVAVYPTVALFNHDCYPSITRYFHDKHIVINAIRPLNPNDVIAENYGPIFIRRKLMERQRSLSARYWFNCRCVPCLEDWPSFDTGLNSFIKRVRCPNRKCGYLYSLPLSKTNLKCPNCQKDVSLDENIEKLKWCEDQYEMAFKLTETNNDDGKEAFRILSQALDIFHKVSAPPHRETHLAQEVLRLCLANSGNTYECPPVINKK